MNLRASTTVLCLLTVAFSGCFGAEEDPTTAGTSTSAAPDSSSPSTSAPNETEAFDPPVASFQVAPSDTNETNLTAGIDLVFNASASTDPAGGNLSFAWDLGDGNATEGVTTNHTYSVAGNYTVVLTVSSSESELNGTANQTLALAEGAPKSRVPVTYTDPSGDGTTTNHDLRQVTVSDDGVNLIVKFTVGAVQPSGNIYTPICHNMWITGTKENGSPGTAQRYELFGDPETQKYTIYDYPSPGGPMAGTSIKVVGAGFEIMMPLETVHKTGISFPYQFFMDSRAGDCYLLAPTQILDRAPNTGFVAYG